MKVSSNIAFYIIGLIIGTILVTIGIINILNPVVKYVDYSEEEIRERARELGMVDIKENIESNMGAPAPIVNDDINTENDNSDELLGTELENNGIKDSGLEIEEKKEQNSGLENKNPLNSIKEEGEYINFEIKRGEDSNAVIKRLYEMGIINDIDEFIEHVRKRGAARRIIYGKFRLEKGMEYDKIIDHLVGL